MGYLRNGLEGRHIPDLAAAISRGSKELSGVRRPTATVDTTSMSILDVLGLFTGLSVIEDQRFVRTSTDKKRSVGGPSYTVDEASVGGHMLLELEGRSFIPVDTEVFTTRSNTVGSVRLHGNGVGSLDVTREFSHRGTRIHEESVSIPTKSSELNVTKDDNCVTMALTSHGHHHRRKYACCPRTSRDQRQQRPKLCTQP